MGAVDEKRRRPHDRINQPAVVVVGSLHYDIMVDAPGPPAKGETVTGFAGGLNSAARAATRLLLRQRRAPRHRMAGAVGDDDFGRFLLSEGAGEPASTRRRVARFGGTARA